MTPETTFKRKAIHLLTGIMLFSFMVPSLWASEASSSGSLDSLPLGKSTIRVGLSPYADELATTALGQQLLEKLGYKIQTSEADLGIWFGGIAHGDLDVGLNAWLPVTHGAYYKRYKDKLVDLGVIYEPAKLGWAVPDYIPKDKLTSISDLKKPEIKERLDGTITGISAGAGLTRASEKAIKEYGLDKVGYSQLISSGPAMTAALARAIQHDKWIVVTAWTPHWMWARWKLRYLKDPKEALGKGEAVHIVATPGFRENFPRATAFLQNFHVPVSGIEEIMNTADKLSNEGKNGSKSDPYTVAAQKYIESHPKLVKKWLSPKLATN